MKTIFAKPVEIYNITLLSHHTLGMSEDEFNQFCITNNLPKTIIALIKPSFFEKEYKYKK